MPRIDLLDMVGVRVGDRVVIEYAGRKKWLTQCSCGLRSVIAGADLRRRVYRCIHDREARFWEKVAKTHDCWIWIAGIHGDGYGRFRSEEGMALAHVFSWRLVNGSVPHGLELDHLRRNRACVNPAHLEPVTHAENVKRGRLGQVTRERHRLARNS